MLTETLCQSFPITKYTFLVVTLFQICSLTCYLFKPLHSKDLTSIITLLIFMQVLFQTFTQTLSVIISKDRRAVKHFSHSYQTALRVLPGILLYTQCWHITSEHLTLHTFYISD